MDIATTLPTDLEPIGICKPCLELNLITAIHIQNCIQCGTLYCIHGSSTIDPRYCIHCLHDVNITITMYRAPIEDTGATKLTKIVKFGGVHHLFQQRKIAVLTEQELELSIEYHQMIVKCMIFERERKRNSKMHRNAGVPYKLSATSEASVAKVKAKKVRKAASKNNTDLQAMLANMTPAQRLNLLNGLKAMQAQAIKTTNPNATVTAN